MAINNINMHYHSYTSSEPIVLILHTTLYQGLYTLPLQAINQFKTDLIYIIGGKLKSAIDGQENKLLYYIFMFEKLNFWCFKDNSISSQSTLNLNIATYNAQGYNAPLKRQLWEEFCLSNNIQICSITKTKLAESKPKKFFNNKQFTYFWSCLNNSAEGTGIMVNNTIKSHIHNVITHPGGAVAIDLFFKYDFKFRIISVYLSSTNQQI
ncbi:hypothetical protein C2G38_2234604 [Gigaspora rosea]|uniref:Uncharacterized protein n=1 Tax=Gigaspora rosea TaxID=44941 RepID=A0A397TR30_9GLOM|nr:hypothetical protein C2G38_2234604 [Gigaspora rosea]